eukprot:257814-Rhodomonas_salina.1
MSAAFAPRVARTLGPAICSNNASIRRVIGRTCVPKSSSAALLEEPRTRMLSTTPLGQSEKLKGRVECRTVVRRVGGMESFVCDCSSV